MVLLSQEISVSRCHTLQVNDVATLVRASDSFNLNATGNFNFLSFSINNFVDLDIHFLAHLKHHLVELWIALYCLLLIDCSVLCEGCKLRVVQDSGDD